MKPEVVVVDPLSALMTCGTLVQSRMMVLRLIDYVKSFGATALYLAVRNGQQDDDLDVSSLMDTWIVLENERKAGELERSLHVVKSRGMPHSAEIRRFLISEAGIEVQPGREAT